MTQFQRIKLLALKLLLANGAIVGAITLYRLLLLPALQSLLQTSDAVTGLMRRWGILLLILLSYWAYVRWFEKRPVSELRPAPLGIALGAVSGAGLISIATTALFALGAYEVTVYRGLQDGLLGVVGVIVIAALWEEVVFRGVLFQALETAWGTMPALWLQSVIFALMHVANIEDRASTLEVITTVLSVTLLGAFWALVFVHTRNLWVVAANHAAWNFAIVLTGTPLSGGDEWRGLAPITSEYRGPNWLTGGVFGPEASIVAIALAVIAVAALWHRAKMTKRLVGTSEVVETGETAQFCPTQG